METTSTQTQVSKILLAKTYSALSFDRIKLFNIGEFVFSLSETNCYVLFLSWANKIFLFWRLSNDCQIARPALVSGPPNWKKPYNKHLISLAFSVRTVNSSLRKHPFLLALRCRGRFARRKRANRPHRRRARRNGCFRRLATAKKKSNFIQSI